jgi:hypothetical protein
MLVTFICKIPVICLSAGPNYVAFFSFLLLLFFRLLRSNHSKAVPQLISRMAVAIWTEAKDGMYKGIRKGKIRGKKHR